MEFNDHAKAAPLYSKLIENFDAVEFFKLQATYLKNRTLITTDMQAHVYAGRNYPYGVERVRLHVVNANRLTNDYFIHTAMQHEISIVWVSRDKSIEIFFMIQETRENDGI